MKKNYLIGLALMAAVAVLPGCKDRNQPAAQVEQSENRALVTTQKAALEEVPQTAEFTSNIRGFKENNIAPTQPLRIEKILVEVGSTVRKGQLLATMDPTQLNQTSVQLANAEADYNRLKPVYDAGGISQQQMESTETQLKVLRDSHANLLANTELRSPIDGIVTARNYDPGNIYNGAMPVLTVMQINQVKVSVSISEQYFPMVKLGMPADIMVDTYPGKVFEGKVSLISPAIDAATRTFGIEVTIGNGSHELRPGMFSRTRLNFGSKEGIMVEDVAVQKQPGTNEKYVFIVQGGKAVRRNVATGIQAGNRIEMVSGVNDGDEVVITGISRLQNGSTVEIKN